MKIWIRCLFESNALIDRVHTFAGVPDFSVEFWDSALLDVFSDCDLSRPVILNKHVRELKSFGRTTFKKADFIDDIPYDMIEICIIPEKKTPNAH